MRRSLTVILVCPLLLSGSAPAEQRDDSVRILADLTDRLRAYQHEARARQLDLAQRLEILDRLLQAVDAIALRGGSLDVAESQRKLAEARARASQPPHAGRPVPVVLDELAALLDRPPFGATPERLRGLAVQTLVPLEENVVELEEAVWSESALASSLRDGLVQAESSLRASWLAATRVSVETRRAALGLRLSLRPPSVPRPPARVPRFPADLREHVRAYVEDVQGRQYDLARRTFVLNLLTTGGDAIPARGGSLPAAGARQRLEEARAHALQAPPLEAPVPDVLARLGPLLDGLSSGAAAPQGRASYFWTLGPLEQNVLEAAEGLRAEAATLSGLAASLLQIDDGSFRGPVLEALHASIRARLSALGLRSVRRKGEAGGGRHGPEGRASSGDAQTH